MTYRCPRCGSSRVTIKTATFTVTEQRLHCNDPEDESKGHHIHSVDMDEGTDVVMLECRYCHENIVAPTEEELKWWEVDDEPGRPVPARVDSSG